jgi:nucleoside-diphosphate-sugar epimerase
MILAALRHCTTPISPLNISGPETVSIRALAESLGGRLGKRPILTGSEASTAWLVNTQEAMRLFGYPSVPLKQMIDWTADWVGRAMPSLGKDTHYGTRDGLY